MKFHIAIAVSAILAACPVQAAPADAGRFAVEGGGMLQCSSYLAARSDKTSNEYQRLIGFIEGYLTAANRYEPNTFDLSPWHNAMAFDIILGNHCKEHPADTIVSVVQRMVTGFRTIRVATFSPLIEVGDEKNKTYVYEAVLRRAEQALKVRGLYNGAEAGGYSPPLAAAFAQFQKSKGLESTGVPDPATLWLLLNP